jgi:predicted glycosyltransferase
MIVWIDLANSPHPLLFAPIARRLRERGDEVAITARDHAQTLELAREHFGEVEVIGEASPDGRLAKAAAVGGRLAALRRWARGRRLDLALSHNSYAQLLAARALRLPTVTAMDFEHQPANHVAFRAAQTILVPEAVPIAPLRRAGARPGKLVRYRGLKEELYLADFEPDRSILSSLGFDRNGSGEVIAIARSAPAGAAYHRHENPIFLDALRTLDGQAHVRTVVLARHPAQRAAIRELGLERAIVPEHAIDSRSLMIEADVFVGAGGTMTREAALLGVPTYSIFDGERPAVDAWLERRGALRMLDDPGRLADLGPRGRGAGDDALAGLRERGAAIEDVFLEAIDARAGR